MDCTMGWLTPYQEYLDDADQWRMQRNGLLVLVRKRGLEKLSRSSFNLGEYLLSTLIRLTIYAVVGTVTCATRCPGMLVFSDSGSTSTCSQVPGLIFGVHTHATLDRTFPYLIHGLKQRSRSSRPTSGSGTTRSTATARNLTIHLLGQFSGRIAVSGRRHPKCDDTWRTPTHTTWTCLYS